MPITCADVELHTNKDKDLTEIENYVKLGFPSSISNSNLVPYKNLLVN